MVSWQQLYIRPVPILTCWFAGDDEQDVPEAYAKRVCAGFAQLGARGISVLFSSGDHGVGVDGYCFSNAKGKTNQRVFLPVFPASCPWVTSVGATKGFSPEVATYVLEILLFVRQLI